MKLNYHIVLILSCFLAVLCGGQTQAQSQKELFNPSGLEIPRFVSFKSNKIFARKGPGKRFPIEWVYQRRNLPVEVIQEFDTWRKVKDHEGAESWVHQSLISGERYVVVTAEPYARLFTASSEDSKVVALVENSTVLEVQACKESFCKVDSANFSGWISKKAVWGIYESEQFH